MTIFPGDLTDEDYKRADAMSQAMFQTVRGHVRAEETNQEHELALVVLALACMIKNINANAHGFEQSVINMLGEMEIPDDHARDRMTLQ